jgi:hypothetical protein
MATSETSGGSAHFYKPRDLTIWKWHGVHAITWHASAIIRRLSRTCFGTHHPLQDIPFLRHRCLTCSAFNSRSAAEGRDRATIRRPQPNYFLCCSGHVLRFFCAELHTYMTRSSLRRLGSRQPIDPAISAQCISTVGRHAKRRPNGILLSSLAFSAAFIGSVLSTPWET